MNWVGRSAASENEKSHLSVTFVLLAEREGLTALIPERGEVNKTKPSRCSVIFPFSSSLLEQVRQHPKTKKSPFGDLCFVGGERGIRTPGPVTVNGFQDRRIRPLCHLSGCKIIGCSFNFQINHQNQ